MRTKKNLKSKPEIFHWLCHNSVCIPVVTVNNAMPASSIAEVDEDPLNNELQMEELLALSVSNHSRLNTNTMLNH
jgi:hypothetical protein